MYYMVAKRSSMTILPVSISTSTPGPVLGEEGSRLEKTGLEDGKQKGRETRGSAPKTEEPFKGLWKEKRSR